MLLPKKGGIHEKQKKKNKDFLKQGVLDRISFAKAPNAGKKSGIDKS